MAYSLLNAFLRSFANAEQAGFSPMAPAQGATQTCASPLSEAPPQPCDVDFLRLTALAPEDKAKAGYPTQSVTALSPADSDASLTPEQRVLLAGDDLVLQVVAGYHADTDEPEKYDVKKTVMQRGDSGWEAKSTKKRAASVWIDGRTSPACPAERHMHVIWTPLSGADRSENMEWVRSAPTERKVLAASTRNIRPWGFLDQFWSFGDHRRSVWLATIESCGVRDGHEPTRWMTGRVEVYPDDRFELSWKLPPLGKLTFEKFTPLMPQTVFDRKTTTKYEASTWFGSSSEEHKLWEHPETGVRRRETKRTVRNGEFAVVREESGNAEVGAKPAKSKTALEGDLEFGRQVSLKRNGVELDVTKTISAILKFAADLEEAIRNVEKAFAGKPRLGYKYGFNLSIMEGTLTGSWGVAPRMAGDHSRIWKVEETFSIEFSLILLSLKLEGSFGVEFSVPFGPAKVKLFEIVALIEGSLKLEAKASGYYASSAPEKPPIAISESVKGQLGARFKATVFGQGVSCSIEVEIKWEFKGDIYCSKSRAFGFEGSSKIAPIVATFRASVLEDKPFVVEWTLWEEVKFWEGKLPGVSPAGAA